MTIFRISDWSRKFLTFETKMVQSIYEGAILQNFSTKFTYFPHNIILGSLHFSKRSGVLSIHRKSNLPAEESGRRAIERIGNETYEASGQLEVSRMAMRKLVQRVGSRKELGERGLRFAKA